MDNFELREKAPHETVREYAYRVLYQNIMTLKLPPGTAMSEQELSGVLNVSRTPVREAFIRLAEKRPAGSTAPARNFCIKKFIPSN